MKNKVIYFFICIVFVFNCKNNEILNPKYSKLDYEKIRQLANKQYESLDTINTNETMWLLARYINEELSTWACQDTALAVVYRYSLINPKHESLKYLSVHPPSRELFELTIEILPECIDNINTLNICSFLYSRDKIGNYKMLDN